MEKKKIPEGIKIKNETDRAVFEITLQLDELPHSTLVRIGHHIGGNVWIDDLPGKPDGWDDMSEEQKNKWSHPIYNYIEGSVGNKALLRYFHTTELGRTNAEFEDWWDSIIFKAIKGLL